LTTTIIAKNQTQKSPRFAVNGGTHREVLQPHTWYTCPTGKKARVIGVVQCTSRGAAATVDFDIGGVTNVQWDGSSFSTSINYSQNDRLRVPNGVGLLVNMLFDVDLVAGQDLETNQNTGTNAEINMFAYAIESDI